MFCKNCGTQVPEGSTFCANCGTAVEAVPTVTPVAAPVAAPAAAPKADKSALIKLIAVIAAVAIVLGLFISLLGGGNPKSLAKKFVQASIEEDYQAMISMSIGNMNKMLKKDANDKIMDKMFEAMEERGEEVDVDVSISKLNQYYKAAKKVAKAELKEDFGKNYKVKVEVRKVEDMRSSEIEAIQDMYDNDTFENYVNVNKIKKGKWVTVKVIIDGSEDTETDDYVIAVVKYKGKWVVADEEVVDIMTAVCFDMEDYLKDLAKELDMTVAELKEYMEEYGYDEEDLLDNFF